MEVLKTILVVYSVVAVGMLIVFLWRIAYFYEKTSGQPVGYCFILLPALLLAAGGIWYLARNVEFIGEPIGDSLLCAGGVFLLVFGFRLQELMTGERR